MTPAQRIAATRTYASIPPERTRGLLVHREGLHPRWRVEGEGLTLDLHDWPDLDDPQTREILRGVAGVGDYVSDEGLANRFEASDVVAEMREDEPALSDAQRAEVQSMIAEFAPDEFQRLLDVKIHAIPPDMAQVEVAVEPGWRVPPIERDMNKRPPQPSDPTTLAGWDAECWELLRGADCADWGGCAGEIFDTHANYWGVINPTARRTLDRLVVIVERSERFRKAVAQLCAVVGVGPTCRDGRWRWAGAAIGGFNSRAECVHAAVTACLS